MATINGYTAEKMQEIADAAIETVEIVGDDLVIHQKGGGTINAGHVRGFPGISDMALYDPVGVPKPYELSGTAPTGYGICDASTPYSAASYPILAAEYGTGADCINGATTAGNFLLPDYRGKSLFGMHGGIVAFDTLHKIGGSKDAIVVSHDHGATADQAPHAHTGSAVGGGVDHYHGTQSAGSHGHSASIANVKAIGSTSHTHQNQGGYVSEAADGSGEGSPAPVNVDGDGYHNHGNTYGASAYSHGHGLTIDLSDPGISVDVQHEGVSAADKNLPPYRVVRWIMRLA